MNSAINKIKLIVYDFDGVMTVNKVYVDQNGNEMVSVNRSDGLGVSEIKKLGIKQIIFSTEKNPVVSARAKKLGIYCLQNIDELPLIQKCMSTSGNIDLPHSFHQQFLGFPVFFLLLYRGPILPQDYVDQLVLIFLANN